MRFKLLILVVLSLVQYASGQVLTLSPTFPTQTDTVTITYNAALGNGALEGQTVIYAHMGLITSESNSPSDWKYVVGEWGTADSKVKMTSIGANKFSKTYDISDFHQVPQSETVLKLAFVFRTADGSIVGRDSDGGDIFVDIYTNSYSAAILSPSQSPIIVKSGDTINVQANTSENSFIRLNLNGSLLDSISNSTSLNTNIPVDDFGKGTFTVEMIADNGSNTIIDSFYYVYPDSVSIVTQPSGIKEGVNIINDSTVILSIFAPFKEYIFAIGDFCSWQLNTDYLMNKSEDGEHFWIELTGLDSDKEYRFQYQIEDELRVADVYSEKILDPWNDPFINEDSETLYPNLTPYPVGLTNDPVSVFQINKPQYNWDSSIQYQRPEKERLVVYEVLLRDFFEDHSYRALRDTLDYLSRLGINAIELMPVNEFEGNDSWGYNPSFYFAPDKYYGTSDDLKSLIEECHRKGIAVIFDIALNHSFGQNPQVRMYFDPAAGSYGQPTPNSPWFNPVARHDYNVGYDYNHESPKTKEFVDRVLAYWIEEYRIDGFRMDLSKGFTQVNSLGDVGKWGQRDASRIAIWKRIKDELDKVDPNVIMILEHFADNEEEKELSALGFMLWGNINESYRKLTVGVNSNIDWISYKRRGWSDPHVVGYMESHDEERLMYRNKIAGLSNGDYDIKELATGLERVELAANFFLTIPGPKMIWQFGELGFDYSINTCDDGTSISNDCRLSRKPIVWDYLEVPERRRLLEVYSALNHIRNQYDVIHTNDFELDIQGAQKQIRLDGDDMDIVVLGNFGIEETEIDAEFLSTGKWYELYTGDSIEINATNVLFSFLPGEYRLYSSEKIEWEFSDTFFEREPEAPVQTVDILAYPNPFNSSISIGINSTVDQISRIQVYDINGKEILNVQQILGVGFETVEWNGKDSEGHKLPAGKYVIKVVTANSVKELNVVLMI